MSNSTLYDQNAAPTPTADLAHLYVAILAGGVGTRLWPHSRPDRPKQFTRIQPGDRTLIQSTADRVAPLAPPDHIYIITGARYTELAHAQLPQLSRAQILAEPCGRNTAPAIGLACLFLRQRDPNAVLVALPSDHVIADQPAFRHALTRAYDLAHNDGYIVTLGIEPTFAHTGYGYIQRARQPLVQAPQTDGDGVEKAGPVHAYAVARFLEKPPLSQAQEFLANGGYYWNAGMFICRAQDMLDEIDRQLPDLSRGLAEIDRALNQPPHQVQAVIDEVWPHLPNISVDHGIMEGARQVAVIPLAAGWNDVGSWDALEAVVPPREDGNIVAGGTLHALDSTGNIVYAEQNKIVALIGIDDLVVVDTGDAILVGKKDQMQRVKEIADRLAKNSN